VEPHLSPLHKSNLHCWKIWSCTATTLQLSCHTQQQQSLDRIRIGESGDLMSIWLPYVYLSAWTSDGLDSCSSLSLPYASKRALTIVSKWDQRQQASLNHAYLGKPACATKGSSCSLLGNVIGWLASLPLIEYKFIYFLLARPFLPYPTQPFLPWSGLG